jgi:four helix bundle protein
MTQASNSFRDLIVWKKAMELARQVYALTRRLPKEELYALGDQMRRAAVSIPSNIAEGQARDSRKEFLSFLSIAKGSNAELGTQLELCTTLGYLSAETTLPVAALSVEVGRMLTSLSSRLKSSLPQRSSPLSNN